MSTRWQGQGQGGQVGIMGGFPDRVARHQGQEAKETVVVGTRYEGQLAAVISASEGELRGRQGGGGTEHLPPALSKGQGDLSTHILRQGGRVSTSTHGEGLGQTPAQLAGRRTQPSSGVNSKGGEIPPNRLAGRLALDNLGTFRLRCGRRPPLTHRRRSRRAQWVVGGRQ